MKDNLIIKDFWNNVAKLASGSLVSQIFLIALTPVIARIYSPSDYGTLSLVNSIVGIIVIVSSFRLERALILVDKNNSNRLLSLCNTIAFFFSIIVLLIVLLFGNYINNFFKIQPTYILYIIPALIFSNAILNSFKSYGNSFKVYGLLTSSIVINSILSSSLKLLGSFFFKPSAILLIASESISVIATLIFLIITFNVSNIDFKYILPSKKFILHTINEQKQFLKFDILSSLLNNFSWLMPVILLSYYFDKSVVGYYSLGFTMLRLPMNLLGKAIGDVYYKTASDTTNDYELKNNTLKIVVKLFGFGLLPILFVTVYGNQLFVLLFGQKWELAGVYSQILSLWSLMWFVTSPITTIYYIKNIQNKFLNFTIVSLIFRALSLIIGGLCADAVLGIILFSVSSFSLYLFQLLYLLNKINISYLEVFTSILKEIKYAFLVIIIFLILYFYEINFVVTIAISSLCILGYFLYKLLEIKKIK